MRNHPAERVYLLLVYRHLWLWVYIFDEVPLSIEFFEFVSPFAFASETGTRARFLAIFCEGGSRDSFSFSLRLNFLHNEL